MRNRKLGVKAIAVSAAAGAALVAIALGCSRSEAAPTQGQPSAETAPQAGAAKIDGKNFKLEIKPDGECKAGADCAANIVLESLNDFHINKEYPYKFTAADAPGVTFLGGDPAGKVFSKAAGDFKQEGENKATMRVRFKPGKAGTIALKGKYKFSVCSAANCQLDTQDLELAVAVK